MDIKDINKITEITIDSAIQVKRALGIGFLEAVYQNALEVELKYRGLNVEKEKPINIFYRNTQVGYYRADLFINNCLIVEIKVAETIDKAHEIQLVNYLQTTGIDDGLIINFGSERIGLKRKFRLYNKA